MGRMALRPPHVVKDVLSLAVELARVLELRYGEIQYKVVDGDVFIVHAGDTIHRSDLPDDDTSDVGRSEVVEPIASSR